MFLDFYSEAIGTEKIIELFWVFYKKKLDQRVFRFCILGNLLNIHFVFKKKPMHIDSQFNSGNFCVTQK